MGKCPIPWDKEFDKNKKYIWMSETGKNTCQECKSLDGKIFTGDKVPLRPHPNCKCEVVESNFKNNRIVKSSQTEFNFCVKHYDKSQVDAIALWHIASEKFEGKTAKEYIEKNGKIVDEISDLNNQELEHFIKAKLKKQIGKEETRGIIFHKNSSLSKAIKEDKNFQKILSKIINENINRLRLNYSVKTSIKEFESVNLKNAVGEADIINIRMDSFGNIYALLIDTYDFNADDDRLLVLKGRGYQEKGLIENYYYIVTIKMSKNELQQYLQIK